jgi:hypothetical protein
MPGDQSHGYFDGYVNTDAPHLMESRTLSRGWVKAQQSYGATESALVGDADDDGYCPTPLCQP